MNIPLNNCIYCSSTADLNTQLSVLLESGERVQVQICDVHAEDATVKTARDAFIARQKQITDFMVQAAKLGITLAQPTTSGIVVGQVPKPQVSQPMRTSTTNSQEITPAIEDDMVDASLIDAKSRKGMVSVGGRAPDGNIGAYKSHMTDDVREQIPDELLRGKIKFEQTEDRAGRQISIPTKRIDGLGITSIRIVKGNDDGALQKRFKQMADMSRRDQQPDFRNEYDIKECPICHGAQTVKNLGVDIDCPKCKGQGIV